MGVRKIKWSDPQLIRFQIESGTGLCTNGTDPGTVGGGIGTCVGPGGQAATCSAHGFEATLLSICADGGNGIPTPP